MLVPRVVAPAGVGVVVRVWVGKEEAEGPVIWMSGIIIIGMPSDSVLLLGRVGVEGWNG